MSRWLTFYRCPQCDKRQAYLIRSRDGQIVSISCRTRGCLDATIFTEPGEPVEATLRRGYDAWAQKLAAKIASAE